MILSVSRRTDIPRYYGDWFLNRMKEEYVYVRNPMNPRQISRICLSRDVIDGIVFWTKFPESLLPRLDELEGFPYYVQFTLNGYGKELEPGLADRSRRIAVFQKLAGKIGKERVVWRYDPILFCGAYDAAYHVRTFGQIAAALSGYTEQAVISFLDFYAKTERNLAGMGIRRPADEECILLAEKLAGIAARYGMKIESCAEKLELSQAGVPAGSCIDKRRLERILGCGLNAGKDRGQREACGCCESIDIGTYHTCPAGCRYCYANFSEEKVTRERSRYSVSAPLLCGSLLPGEMVTERKTCSLKNPQMSFLEGFNGCLAQTCTL